MEPATKPAVQIYDEEVPRSLGAGEPFYRPFTPYLPHGGTTVEVIEASFAESMFSFTPIQPERQAKSRIQVLRHLKNYKGANFYRKGWLLSKQGAPPHIGRCYFQKYVDEATKKEFEDIFRAATSEPHFASSGRRALLDLDVEGAFFIFILVLVA